MKSNFKHLLLAVAILLVASYQLSAQQIVINNDSLYQTGTPNTGRVWGYAFGDYYYKGHGDSLNRGGPNQYTGLPQNRNAFQFRRIYLGYDYNISKKFSAELLLAAEDNFPAYNPPTSNAASGDLTSNGKETFFIKLANVKWKNIWNGTDLVVGEQSTPAFAMMSEKVWNYRSVERTITDIRRTPSYDLGAGLQGTFDPKTKHFGYNLLVATGNSDKPATNSYKWFYGDVWGTFLDKKLLVDLYADYERLNWAPGWHHDRQMLKAFVAYNTPIFTVGVEGYVNTIRQDVKATLLTPVGGHLADTINTSARGLSLFLHGDIIPSTLRWYARVDTYNPNHNIDNSKYKGYAPLSSPSGYSAGSYKIAYGSNGVATSATAVGDPTSSVGDITSKEVFATAGLDFTPIKNVHFEPNVWYNHYESQLAAGKFSNHDMVYRMTFYFMFGKSYKNTYNQF